MNASDVGQPGPRPRSRGAVSVGRRQLLSGAAAMAAVGAAGLPMSALGDDGGSTVASGGKGQCGKAVLLNDDSLAADGTDHADVAAPSSDTVLSFFYNGTDSNYDIDVHSEGRFQHGELVSRLGLYASAVVEHNEDVTDSTHRLHGVGLSKRGRFASRALGRAFGKGMYQDVLTIVETVMDERAVMLEDDTRPHQTLRVTLTGWSRGAVGCIYAAHLLGRRWREAEQLAARDGSNSGRTIELKVCLVALDPVSGKFTNFKSIEKTWEESRPVRDLLSKRTRWWQLDEHITEFHGFYAHDERSKGFAATIPSRLSPEDASGSPDRGKCRKTFLYEVPGTHSTLVGNVWPAGGDAPFKQLEQDVPAMPLSAADAFFTPSPAQPELPVEERLAMYRAECAHRQRRRSSTSRQCKDNASLADPVGLFIYRRMVTKVLNILTDFGVAFHRSSSSPHPEHPTLDIQRDWLDGLGITHDPSNEGEKYHLNGTVGVILAGPQPVRGHERFKAKAVRRPSHVARSAEAGADLEAYTAADRRAVVAMLKAYKARCQQTYILLGGGRKNAKRQGRGVYIGSNRRQRHWAPHERLSTFMTGHNRWLWNKSETHGPRRDLLVGAARPREGKLAETNRLKANPTAGHAVTVWDFSPHTMDWCKLS